MFYSNNYLDPEY